MIITKSVTLKKNAVMKEGIVITASNITIDGNGATLAGPGKKGEKRTFTGVGILAKGCSNVTIKNIKAHGFETGLQACDGAGWVIEHCDFSDNYTDIEFGWGEYKRVGGIVLDRICGSTIRNNKAQRVWNALDLNQCNDNLVENNLFSHTTNVCLKTMESCRNSFIKNDFSWGLRIKPGEVHARDSTGVLMENGSDDNYFYRNDVTHGGDGIFLRALNGWVSSGNIFVENDCSYAHNNGFEAWVPGNTYIRNKANYCSYGFWLGGSDRTVLIGNEAAYNGVGVAKGGHNNATDHGFKHGGIVIVSGSASHIIVDGNYCHHNAGGGINLRGYTLDKKCRAWHWIIQRNRLEHNLYPIYSDNAGFIDIGPNECKKNKQKDIIKDTVNLRRLPANPKITKAPKASLVGRGRYVVGETAVFDASGSSDPDGRKLNFRWEIDGVIKTGAVVKHVFKSVGFHRVGVTVDNGSLADLAGLEIHVVASDDAGCAAKASAWEWSARDKAGKTGKVNWYDDDIALIGKTALKIKPEPMEGYVITGIHRSPKGEKWNLSHKKKLTFWMRPRDPNVSEMRRANPIIRLVTSDGELCYMPTGEKGHGRNMFLYVPYTEARWAWQLVQIPLAGGDGWSLTKTGKTSLAAVEWLSIQFEEPGREPFEVWLDGLKFE